MTAQLGIGMFIYNMFALLIGVIIIYYVIDKVDKDRKRKEKLEYLKGRKWKQDDTE